MIFINLFTYLIIFMSMILEWEDPCLSQEQQLGVRGWEGVAQKLIAIAGHRWPVVVKEEIDPHTHLGVEVPVEVEIPQLAKVGRSQR